MELKYDTETHMHDGRSKREYFNWSIKNTAGEFLWLDKNALYVDNSYQRTGSNKKANAIASEWNWVACGAISVSRREDETFFVMDGQHRVLAAKKRDDIKELPCLVFEVGSVVKEAQGFLDTNTCNRTPRMAEKYRAMLLAEYPEAMKLDALATKYGLEVSNESGPGLIGCIGLLMKWLSSEKGEQCVYNVFPIVVELCEGRVLHSKIIEGLLSIELRLLPEQSLCNPLYKRRVLKAGYDELLSSIAKSVAFHTRGGGRSFAEGILQAMNRGCQNRLELNS